MNKKDFGRWGLAVVALMLALTPVLGCAAPKEAPPAEVVKPDKVVFHHFGDLSGPYAPITSPIIAGLDDFIEWHTAEFGGIDGVPIEQVFRDTGGKTDAALAAYQAFKEMEPYPFIMFTYQSTEAELLRDRYVEDKILAFTAGLSPTAMYPPGYQFAICPAYTDLLGAFIDWVTEDWAKKTGEDVKLAILTWDTTFGKAIMVPEVRDYAASKGVDIVYEGVFGVRELDVATQMTAIREAGANWVYDNTTAHGPKVISAAADAMGMLNKDVYDTTPGMIHRAGGPWAGEESVVNLAGELAEGMVSPRGFASWAMTDVEGVAQIIVGADAHDRKAHERVTGYLAAWALAYTAAEAVGKIVEEVGWENLSGETMREEFLKFQDYSPKGLTYYTFAPDKTEPRKAFIIEVQDGKCMPITDWVTCPDLRPSEFK